MIEPLQLPAAPAGSPHPPNTVRTRSRAGFSLVELSLALLVVSIGLISLIGLFPASLDMSKRAIDETYASFLADSAFSSYREAAKLVPWDALNTYQPIAPNTISRNGAVNNDVFWERSVDLRLVPDNTVRTLVFTAGSTEEKWKPSAGWVLPDSWSMEDHALRYRLRIENASPAQDPRIKRVFLEVWMGQFGNINNEQPERFYTEIFRHKVVN
ncbi:MAG TPA: prepilin-type N-terminal cleavage/methylation domain-containing protein [Kiritimatiellia bacterium]|nr:prepilin-type N-terminal cleavage/methylation domain-containing protein [Kiritimatiellia bacterium]HMP35760.1 prepilin-type N-terminal cleavage/methylation domain-containing protein [Kiritimatiellia bacterium]